MGQDRTTAATGDDVSFPTTRWSLLHGASLSSELGRKSLGELLHAYEPVIRRQLRRYASGEEDIDDLCQAFAEHVMQRDFFAKADPGVGPFRRFLASSLKNFGSNRRRARGAARRSPETARSSEDLADLIPSSWLGPDEEFERDWAHAALARALDAVREEIGDPGKQKEMESLLPFLEDNGERGELKALAESMGLKPATLRVRLHRLKERLSGKLRILLADTVQMPRELDDEHARVCERLGLSE